MFPVQSVTDVQHTQSLPHELTYWHSKLSVTLAGVPSRAKALGLLADHVQTDAYEKNTSSYLDKQLPGVCKQLPSLCKRNQGSAESVGLLIQTELADQLLL
jgi:hypothetical protein